MVEQAEPFGLDLGRPHVVVLTAPVRRLADAETSVAALVERAILVRGSAIGTCWWPKDGMIARWSPIRWAAADGVPMPTTSVRWCMARSAEAEGAVGGGSRRDAPIRAEAPMVTKAHYAVIGDLHEIVPAINALLSSRLGR